MEDKRTWVAVIISILFIFFYTENILNPYLEPARKKQQPIVAQGSSSSVAANTAIASQGATTPAVIGTAATTTVATTVDEAWKLSLNARPTSEQIAAAQTITIETDRYLATLSTLGGRLSSLKLKEYKRDFHSAELVDLVSAQKDGILPGGLIIGDANDAFVQYQVDGVADKAAPLAVSFKGSEVKDIQLTGSLNGNQITKKISISGDSYFLTLSATVNGSLATQPLWLEWPHYVSVAATHIRLNPVTVRTLSEENKVTSSSADATTIGVSPVSPTTWISIEDKYFLATLLPTIGGPNGITIHEALSDGSHLLASRIAGAPGNAAFGLYLGPKDSEILEQVGHQLYRNIDLGFFSFLAFPLLWLLRFFHLLIGNYGLSIIALTLVIKTVFLPLTMVSFKSARAMQELAPEVKALRERITDPTQLNQEMMALYKKRGVNPMGGCFPVLIQIPVFIGLYNALLNAIDLRHAPFALWVQDLSAPEQLFIAGFPVQLMVLILGISMFTQQLMTPAPGMDPAQRKMLLAMPVVLTGSFLMYPLPAGLVLYWIVNNTISIIQQMSIKGTRNISPWKATMVGGAALFAFGFLLTLI